MISRMAGRYATAQVSRYPITADRRKIRPAGVGPHDAAGPHAMTSDFSSVRSALETCLAVYRPIPADPYAFPEVWMTSRSSTITTGTALTGLMSALRKDVRLGAFETEMQVFPGRASSFDLGSLAFWLVRRAQAVGLDGALENVMVYLSRPTFRAWEIHAVSGIALDRKIEVGDFEVIPWKAASQTATTALMQRTLAIGLNRFPDAVLIHPVEGRRVQGKDAAPLPPSNFQRAHDCILCLGLCGPTAPFIVAEWVEADAAVPTTGAGYGLPYSEGIRRDLRPNDDVDVLAPRLVAAWEATASTRRDALRVAAARLNSAIRRASPVDSAIDLGIALEAILLRDISDDRGELTYRLRIRGARWLGANPGERAVISQLLGDLYRMRSTAVHTGRVFTVVRGRPVADVLNDGYALTAKAIRTILLAGEPNWENVTLG